MSQEAPFLSNLNVMDNIALIVDAQKHFTIGGSAEYVKERLSVLHLEDMALRHHTTLSDRDYFFVQLVRASMMQGQSIVIESPFLMVSGEKSIRFVFDFLGSLGVACKDVVIVDLISQRYKYEEELCHIEEC